MATLLTLAVTAACSGGGGGSTSSLSNAGQPAGDWNFFRDGINCQAETEFAGFPLSVSSSGPGTYDVLIGYPGEEFQFEGVFAMDTLTVTGIDTVDGTTIEITNAEWQLDSQGAVMLGLMEVNRDEGAGPCAVTDFIVAYREDGTSQSPVVGPWEWTATTTATSGPCNELGRIELLEVELLPRAAGEFTVDLWTADGTQIQFTAKLNSSTLELSGSDIVGADLVTIESGSSLVFDPATHSMAGSLTVETVDNGLPCEFTLNIHGLPATTGTSWLPYMADSLGSESLVGVDPIEPTSNMDFDGPLGLGLTFHEVAQSFVGIAYGGDFDANTGEVLGRQPETLFYVKGTEIWSVDLRQRANHLGVLTSPEPQLVHSEPSGIQHFEVFSDYGPLKGVLVVYSNLDVQLLEVAANGTVESEALDGLGLFDTIDPASGSYDGVITNSVSEGLRRQRVGELELIDSDLANGVIRLADGSLVYRDGIELKRWSSTSHTSTTFEAAPITVMGPAQGNEFYYLEIVDVGTDYIVRAKRLRESGSVVLLSHSIHGFHGGGLAELNPQVLPTQNRVVIGHKLSSGFVANFSVDKSGFDFHSLAIQELDLSGNVFGTLGDYLYVGGIPGDANSYVMPTDGSAPTTLAEGDWLGTVNGPVLSTRGVLEPLAMLFKIDFDLMVFDASAPTVPARVLHDALPLGLPVTVAAHGAQLLFAVDHDVYYADAITPDSGVRLIETPLEEDVPIF